MDERAIGLVLRAFPLTETSLVVHWLSPGAGRIGTVAKGARRPKSPFRGKLDLFHLAEFSFRRRRSELHTLCEVVLTESFPNLRTDVDLLDCLARATKLLTRSTEDQTPLQAEFDLMLELVRRLNGGGASEFWLSVFEIKFLASQGQEPNWAKAKLDPGIRAVAAKMAAADWADLAKLRPSEVQLRRLAGFLDQFIRHHVGPINRLAKRPS